ncbi:hypothetical protein BDZ88DRAFT_338993 [Geranomyces variabilis]|nr:hypothetical protein BDZ88DRAFT_338993 [Geranomyces variabilis]
MKQREPLSIKSLRKWYRKSICMMPLTGGCVSGADVVGVDNNVAGVAVGTNGNSPTKLEEKATEPYCLLSSNGHSDVLGYGGGQRDDSVFLYGPRDDGGRDLAAVSNDEHVPRCQASLRQTPRQPHRPWIYRLRLRCRHLRPSQVAPALLLRKLFDTGAK